MTSSATTEGAYHGRNASGFSKIAIVDNAGAYAATKQNGTRTEASVSGHWDQTRMRRAYSLGETPTALLNRLLNEPNPENPTSRQTFVTLWPALSNRFARSMRRRDTYSCGVSPKHVLNTLSR